TEKCYPDQDDLQRIGQPVLDEMALSHGCLLGPHAGPRDVDHCPLSVDQARASRRFSASAARNSSVVRWSCSSPMSSARSLVIFPSSTVLMTTSSSWCANSVTSGVPSSLPRCSRPRVDAEIEAIGLVEVGLPSGC